MIRLKMHAMYDHFPDYNPAPGEDYISCFSDTYVKECTEPGRNFALLLEPRSMIGDAYNYVYEHSDFFAYIFTHDSQLLKLPQARYLNWADVWLTTDSEKNKNISLVTSPKNWCPLHAARLELFERFKNDSRVDTFYGDWNNPNIPNIRPEDYLEHYKFSIIIENDIDDFWFTEKVLNCFSTKTVPIYVGARKLYQVFNPDGFIQVDDWHEVPKIIDMLEVDRAYYNRLAAIEDNFKRVEPYKIKWKERFFRDYGALLEDL